MNVETLLGSAGVITFLGAMARKWFVSWALDRPQIASSTAIAEQFRALTEQLDAQKSEIKELKQEIRDLKNEQQRQDAVIHKQATKLTRTEMLTRQFVGLFKEKGIEVPQFMQEELDDLLKSPEAG